MSDAPSEPLSLPALPEASDAAAPSSRPAASDAPSAPFSLPTQGTDGPEVSQQAPSMGGVSMRTGSHMVSFGTPGRSYRASFGGMAPSFAPSPMPRRGDVGNAQGRTPRLVHARSRLPPTPSAGPQASDPTFGGLGDDDDQTYIWGTNLSVNDVESRFRRFVRNFTEREGDSAKYLKLLQQALEDMELAINIDCTDLHAYDPCLYKYVINYPKDVVPLLDGCLRQVAEEDLGTEPEVLEAQGIVVRPFNLVDQRAIRDLDPVDIDRLTSVTGMVTRTSNIIPEMRIAVFQCEACGAEDAVMNNRGQIQEPSQCEACESKFCMRIVHNRCLFNNKQLVKLQESPNEIPEGETPQTLNLFAFDELTDVAKPGDRVTVTGVFRAAPIRNAPRSNRRELRAIYKTHIDIVHVRREEKGRLFSLFADTQYDASQQQREPGTPGGSEVAGGSQGPGGSQAMGMDMSAPEDVPVQMGNLLREQVLAKEQQIKDLANDPDIYTKLVASLAPSIWQMDDVKKGVLAMLFGGVNKNYIGGKTRSEIHVLLVGDPGVSKSQLLTYVNKIAPRGIYTSGRGSSAVGLTAYVSKDPETRDMVLESGALVLSDQGCCCIDEFDKMSDSARSMLHEVMEQQTVSVAKAGIIATLNARTSVLASANPVNSRYNPRLSVIENIQLPPTLLSRFDLIYLVLDKADEGRDRRLAKHLVSLHSSDAHASQQPPISKELLRDYIAYARARCQPVLSDDAMKALVEGYLDMRRMGSGRNVITATARQLESLIRLSEALARMRLATSVESRDVAEAIRLMKVATMQSATDEATGLIDMEAITTGVTLGQRQARGQLSEEIRSILAGLQQGSGAAGGISVLDLVHRLQGQSSVPVSERDVKAALQTMADAVNWNTGTGRVTLVA